MNEVASMLLKACALWFLLWGDDPVLLLVRNHVIAYLRCHL